jgi:hypothetical protein
MSIAEPSSPQQFSLAGLMTFMLACAVYFGMLAATPDYFDYLSQPDAKFPMGQRTRIFITILFIWGLLWPIYRSWHLRHAQTIHFAGPAVFGILGPVFAYGRIVSGDGQNGVLIALGMVASGMYISVVFGFPAIVFLLFRRAILAGRIS